MIAARDVLRQMRALPFADFDQIAPGTSMVIAPHADDESLGCGGLIATACHRGRTPFIIAVTDGVKSHPCSHAYPARRLKAVREQELRAAVSILGGDPERVEFLGLPDTEVPIDGPIFERSVERLVDLVGEMNIATIFVTWRHDPHCDHLASALIGREVARRTETLLRFYPVWGWLLPEDVILPYQHVVGFRLDMSELVDLKRRAIAAHASQYSDLITDDPNGFRLPAQLLHVFESSYEVYLLP